MATISETREIKHTPNNKWCDNCNKHIKSGKPSISVTYFDGDFHEAIVCSTSCMEEFEKELENIPIKEEEDYEEEDNIAFENGGWEHEDDFMFYLEWIDVQKSNQYYSHNYLDDIEGFFKDDK